MIEIPKEWLIGIAALTLAVFALGLICGGSIGYWSGKNARRPVINVKIENFTQELYPALERQGITLDEERKQSLENDIRKSHRKVGFKK